MVSGKPGAIHSASTSGTWACPPRHQATAIFRAAADTDAELTGSSEGLMVAGHRGSRQTAAGVAPDRDYHRFLGLGQHRRPPLRRPGFHIFDRRALAPLRNGLRVGAQLFGQLRERRMRSLYCSSDRVRDHGAPLMSLSYIASFHLLKRIAPSNSGIKHLCSATIKVSSHPDWRATHLRPSRPRPRPRHAANGPAARGKARLGFPIVFSIPANSSALGEGRL